MSHFFKTNRFTWVLALIVLGILVWKKTTFFSHASNAFQQAQTEKITSLGTAQLSLTSSRSETTLHLDADAGKAFVQRFSAVAKAESKKFKIPASVILATAMLQSKAGETELSKTANNFFAVPCEEEWDGPKGSLNGQCYRQYASAWECFRDFSIYLTGREWFAQARKSAGKDWKRWANELPASEIDGAKMAAIIQAFGLESLDQ
ncbi:MAG: glucosaminidase domain-containing protein [Saprospiraceae bacterium]|nr:glucosaminidase domain-containing protein [Saprospiraceae bacterium]